MFDAPPQLKGFVGEEDGFDPLGLSTLFDMVCPCPFPGRYVRCQLEPAGRSTLVLSARRLAPAKRGAAARDDAD